MANYNAVNTVINDAIRAFNILQTKLATINARDADGNDITSTEEITVLNLLNSDAFSNATLQNLTGGTLTSGYGEFSNQLSSAIVTGDSSIAQKIASKTTLSSGDKYYFKLSTNSTVNGTINVWNADAITATVTPGYTRGESKILSSGMISTTITLGDSSDEHLVNATDNKYFVIAAADTILMNTSTAIVGTGLFGESFMQHGGFAEEGAFSYYSNSAEVVAATSGSVSTRTKSVLNVPSMAQSSRINISSSSMEYGSAIIMDANESAENPELKIFRDINGYLVLEY